YAVFGVEPACDNPSFLVQAVDMYLKQTGDAGFVQKILPALDRGMSFVPRNRGTGMVWIDPFQPYCSYGFTDMVCKTGDELFCSLLFMDAAGKIADWRETYQVGDPCTANRYSETAEYIRAHLHQFWNDEVQLYHAATYHCNQPDIWGSAYACSERLAPGEYLDRLSVSLADKTDQYVHRGQIRHIVYPTAWERLQSDSKDYRFSTGGISTKFALQHAHPGRYQNGAYWATPLLWVYRSIARVNPDKACGIVLESVDDFQRNGIWEWIGRSGEQAEQDYAASAVMVYAAAKEAWESAQ
ncbi:MAG TPA: hypothetical protein VGE40_06405, partial [Bacilli bacterium]